MMKKAFLLVGVVLAMEAGDAFGQAPGSAARKTPPPPTPRGAVRSRLKTPPPPPISSLKHSRRASHSEYAKRIRNPYAGDPAGRIDMAGKAVSFYPSARQLSTPNSQKSALRTNTKRITTAHPKTPGDP